MDASRSRLVRVLVSCAGLLAGAACPGPQVGDEGSPAARAPVGGVGWATEVGRRIADSEYQVRAESSGALSFANRVQDLRVRVDPGGTVTVSARGGVPGPLREGLDPWTLSMRLLAWGHADSPIPVGLRTAVEGGCDGSGRVAEDGACVRKVELRGEGLDEWWINGEDGIEQGWTLWEAPPGSGELVIDLAVDGVEVQVAEDGGGATFRRATTTLDYGALAAWDARGDTLPLVIEATDGGLRLRVDAEGAVWPVTVDPLLTRNPWSAQADQASAHFGTSVASAGDTNGDGYGDVVVGAPDASNGEIGEGRAFLYLGSLSGLSLAPSWTAEPNLAYAHFGTSVASAGDTNGDGHGDVVVGAHYFANPDVAEGRAFLYLGSAVGLSTSPAWTAEGNQANSLFGYSVASSGDVNGDGYGDVAVGAFFYDNGQANEGRAFVYLGTASGLSASASWTGESDQADAYFGWSVASAGDVNGDGFGDLVAGAYALDNGQTDEGGAFLYLGSASGLSTSAAWTAEADLVSAQSGWSVASAGDSDADGYDDVLVGAPAYNNGPVLGGRATLYLGSATGLAISPGWTGVGGQADARFGGSVASAGDTNADGFADVLIGASGWDNGAIDEGRAVLYLGGAAGLSTVAAWAAEGDQAGAEFGNSVSAAGDINGDGFADAVVGAHFFEDGETDEGGAFLYYGTAFSLAASAIARTGGDQAGALFGFSVASAGDVNGDGYGDMAAGAPNYDNGEVDEGRAFVFLGSAAGPAVEAAWTAESNQYGAQFGNSVAAAGDVNGDGFGDVIVGATLYESVPEQSDEGRAYLFLGSASGLSASSAWTTESNQAWGYLGDSVAGAGDTNGDGFGDVVIGSYGYDTTSGPADGGAALVFLGSASGLPASPSVTIAGDQTGAYFGASVSRAGDVNGDGFGDVVVGAFGYGNPEPAEGRALLYLGSASGPSTSPAWIAESNQAVAFFGISTAAAGDVNGDAFADVAVGAYGYDNGQGDEGRAWLYLGSASGLSPSAAWTAESNQANAYFGHSVAGAGDTNGDGFADLVVGAHGYDNDQVNEGRAWLYLGSSAGLGASAAATVESDQDQSYFGYSVSSGGDTNGDGLSDIAIGALNYDDPEVDEGAVFVVYGAASAPAPTAGWITSSGQAGAEFGGDTRFAGDVNGDGYCDVLSGAAESDNGQAGEGRAFLYLGSASGPVSTAVWSVESNQAGALLGQSVASAGDVNGDGFMDVIVGAAYFDNGQSDEGRAWLYLGSNSGLGSSPAWAAEPEQAGAHFGRSVASAGDANGDGHDDVLVGAWSYDNGQNDEGRVFLYLGTPSGLSSSAVWTAESDEAGSRFGFSVSSAGDTNGDGFADVVVGAYAADSSLGDVGRAYLYLGSPSGPSATFSWTANSGQESAYFGVSVASAGDVDGDGLGDVIVGASQYDRGQNDEGRAFVYLGTASGLAASPAWTAECNQAGALFGSSVASAGDVNGDGFGDVVVGAWHFDNNQLDEGRVFLYLGSSGGLSEAVPWTSESNQVGAHFGASVSGAGDTNGDGFSDILTGAPGLDVALGDEGRAYVFLGNGGDLRGPHAHPVVPQTRRFASSTPIAPGLRSGTATSFGTAALSARAPFGRTGLKLQVEARPLGSPFLGTGFVTSPTWVDSTLSGALVQRSVTGLAAGTAYHWRGRLLYDPADGPIQGWSPWFYGGTDGQGQGGHVVVGAASPNADADADPDATDCDDGNPLTYTGAPESCDTTDSDCDGSLVDGFANLDGDPQPDCVDLDDDNDGTPGSADCDDLDPASTILAQDGDCDGILTAMDCDDANPLAIAVAADPDCDGVSIQAGLTFRPVPSGSFTMGCVAGRDDLFGGCAAAESPSHPVTLTHTTWVMETEASQSEWATRMGYSPSTFSLCGGDCPVETVNWHEAAAFANAVSAAVGLPTCYTCTGTAPSVNCAPLSGSPYDCRGYRLPTEAEWEYAARGGEDLPFAGSSVAGDVGWYASNAGSTTHPGALKQPNGFGLYDLTGNVMEWSGDFWDGSANYPTAADVDPWSASGFGSSFRGGCWGNAAWYVRTAIRSGLPPSAPSSTIGFRLFRSVPANDTDADGDPDTTDCADADPARRTNGPEACDTIDSDCDGSLVDGFSDFDADLQPDCIDDDGDNDGTPAAADCDDLDPISYTTAQDGDCDGILTASDCDDADPLAIAVSADPDCDGVSIQQGIPFRPVPSGSFTMGCVAGRDDVAGGCYPDESPAHEVTLTHTMWVMETEVTQAQWNIRMGDAPSNFVLCGPDCPVERVNWHEAAAFANSMSVEAGLPSCYSCTGVSPNVTCDPNPGDPGVCPGYRLPTEAEWEYAARGGEDLPYPGSAVVGDVGWYSGNGGATTHPSGGRLPNRFGLFDLAGNVWEWTGDFGDGPPNYPSFAATDPYSASGGNRATRGASYADFARDSRIARRVINGPSVRSNYIGFRLIRSVPGDDDDRDGTPGSADCNDADPSAHPNAPESCDTTDSDCDGSLADGFADSDADNLPDCVDPDTDGDGDPNSSDCAAADPSIHAGATEACDAVDSDCDGSLVDAFEDTDGDGTPDCTDPDDDGDGAVDGLDCGPVDASIHTGAAELCDPIDSNCDGSLVDGFADNDGDFDPDCTDPDDDGDGAADGLDCGPLDPSIHPSATEFCDMIDSNCDGSLVDGFADSDGDFDPDCTDPDDDGDGAADGLDCGPVDASIHPGATEACDPIDSDCDGSIVDGFADSDGDADPDCTDPDDDGDGEGDGTDCAPLDPAIRPGAAEDCDTIDSDCDGSLVDEWTDTDSDGAADCVDDDDDDDGDLDLTDCGPLSPDQADGLPETCDGADADNDCDTTTGDDLDADGDGVTICDGDCDDSDADRTPGAPERCDGVDNDCDGATVEVEDDVDADGYRVCDEDCDDGSSTVHPGASELCDGLDNDCDGAAETADDVDFVNWYADLDGDGFGDPVSPWSGNPDCAQPVGFVEDSQDCDDGEARVHPDADPLCNGVDDDCDGVVDLGGEDEDGDGDGVLGCADAAAGLLADCDDADPTVFPGAEETCGDSVDQDCNGREQEDRDDPQCWPIACAGAPSPSGPGSFVTGLLVFCGSFLWGRRRPRQGMQSA